LLAWKALGLGLSPDAVARQHVRELGRASQLLNGWAPRAKNGPGAALQVATPASHLVRFACSRKERKMVVRIVGEIFSSCVIGRDASLHSAINLHASSHG